jgi:uncharacterized lipoprotein
MKNELLVATLVLFAAGCSTDKYQTRSEMSVKADYLAARSGDAPLDPARKISEQDCTVGVDITAGNLRCK